RIPRTSARLTAISSTRATAGSSAASGWPGTQIDVNKKNISEAQDLDLLDFHPAKSDMRADVLAGLRAKEKWLSSMYFYDERGSQLFDEICELPEYYPTRTELEIMETHIGEMCELI